MFCPINEIIQITFKLTVVALFSLSVHSTTGMSATAGIDAGGILPVRGAIGKAPPRCEKRGSVNDRQDACPTKNGGLSLFFVAVNPNIRLVRNHELAKC